MVRDAKAGERLEDLTDVYRFQAAPTSREGHDVLGPLLFYVLYVLIFGCLCSWLAATKGRSRGAWFFGGLLLGVIALLAIGLSPSVASHSITADRLETSSVGKTKVCPHCAETVQAAARICRFCRYEFSDEDIAAATAASVDAQSFGVWRVIDGWHEHLRPGDHVEVEISGEDLVFQLLGRSDRLALPLSSGGFKPVSVDEWSLTAPEGRWAKLSPQNLVAAVGLRARLAASNDS